MQKSNLRRLGAVIASAAILVTACGSDDESTTTVAAAPDTTAASETSAAGEGVTCEGIEIGFIGALSGDNGALGTNMVNGAMVAITAFNEANPNCQIELTQFDSQGDPAQATPLADEIVNNEAIVALIGPGFSGETKATMPKFEEAGLAMITPGATNAMLSQNGWTKFHRILANDDKQAPGVVKLIKDIIKGAKVGVIDDASEYGKGLADAVREGLGDLDVADATIDPKAADYASAVEAMKSAGVDTIFYGGYYAEAAKLAQQLKDAGVEATFVSGDGALDKAFVDGAGPAAEGAYLTATGAPADVNADFQAAFNTMFGTDPALYSPEAYDCASVFLAAIAAGNTTRESIAAFVETFDAPGITKQIKFDETGEPEGDAVYYYVVESGAIAAKGLI